MADEERLPMCIDEVRAELLRQRLIVDLEALASHEALTPVARRTIEETIALLTTDERE